MYLFKRFITIGVVIYIGGWLVLGRNDDGFLEPTIGIAAVSAQRDGRKEELKCHGCYGARSEALP